MRKGCFVIDAVWIGATIKVIAVGFAAAAVAVDKWRAGKEEKKGLSR